MMQPRKAAGLLQHIGAQGSNDTILAHITPDEAALLKARGGSGKRDPRTGLLHFDDGGDSSSDSSSDSGGYSSSWSSVGAGQDSSPFSGMGSAPAYAGFGEGYTPALNDPSYNAKGYYSAAGGYPGGDDADANPTRYYSDRRTLAGDIANALGYDPEGLGAKLGKVGLAGLSMFGGPWISAALGLAGNISKGKSTPHESDMTGDTGQTGLMSKFSPFSSLRSGQAVQTTPGAQFASSGSGAGSSSGQGRVLIDAYGRPIGQAGATGLLV